jgi:hypothetical protein
VAPSLFSSADPGILSELYGEGGRNQFSWLEGEQQLLRSVAFGEGAPRRTDPRGGEEPSQPRRERRRRQERAFRQTMAWSGPVRDARISRSLWRWEEGGRMVAEGSPESLSARLEAGALRRWLLFAGPEATPLERKLLY